MSGLNMYDGSFKRKKLKRKQPLLVKVIEPGLAAIRELPDQYPRISHFFAVVLASFVAVFRCPVALLALIFRWPMSVGAGGCNSGKCCADTQHASSWHFQPSVPGRRPMHVAERVELRSMICQERHTK